MTTNAPTKDPTGEDQPTRYEGMKTLAADAGERVSDAAGAIRATADQVGDRIPIVVESVRDGALESARTIEAMPEGGQRLLAAFSLGLGVGLSIAGTPRLVVVASLAPAMFVALKIIGRAGSPVGRD